VIKLTYSNLEFQNFPGENPRTPLFKGREGEGRGGEGRGKGRREGKDREGRGGTRGEEWGGEGGEGRGARHGLRPPR